MIELMAGKLSTHALDIYHGRPAAGMTVELWGGATAREMKLLRDTVTNGDGRTDAPLLTGDDFRAGLYELRFQVGAYFKKMKTPLPELAFLDEVPIRFVVADAAASYHVPLSFSPWAYSTYRGT
jgi:5-hydroxyisourate hydrolase